MPGRFRANRQSDIDALEGEPRIESFFLEMRFAGGNCLCHPVAQRVEERTVRFALIRAHAAQGLQQVADRTFFAERGDAYGFQRRFIGRVCNGVQDLTLESLNVAHGIPQFETA